MKKFLISLVAFILLAGISSCVKDKFDEPPAGGIDPDIKVNFTIDSLKARWSGGNYYINEDLVISAIVVGDDKTGNLYKELAIQDSTGGIAFTLGGSYLYNDFPVGRRLFIKLKGLWVTQYKGLFQIVAYINPDGSTSGIPASSYDKYIFPGKWGIKVAPKVVTIANLNDSYQNELIELDGVEFKASDMNQPYANGYALTSYGRTVKDCSGNTAEVYTSGYASFANSKTPSGNGNLICVYQVYNGAPQLIIRDTSEVNLYGTTCNGNVHPSGTGIALIRSYYNGGSTTLPAGSTITGTVISDKDGGNITSKNIVIQDSTGGIVVRFNSTNAFALGDQLTIDLSGGTVADYNGWVQVSGVANASATKIGTGTITPRVATITDIVAHQTEWESTLVKISNVTMSGTTFSGSVTITDGTANTVLYTSSTAPYANTALPTSAVDLTCIVSQFSGLQLLMRNAGDVQ